MALRIERRFITSFSRGVVFLIGIMFVGGCNGSGDPTAPVQSALSLSGEGDSHEIHQQLASLRNLTAPYHDFEVAEADGWSVLATPCLESPDGGQGFHYLNPAFIDGDAVLLEPEILQYEPRKNGQLRLVGVEYVIPFTEIPATADPPELLGHEFHANEDAGLWALHVWLWRHNPSGLHADWNPKVSCEHA